MRHARRSGHVRSREGRTAGGIGHRALSNDGHRPALAIRERRRATGERIMLDPKEAKKGGFGAFAQRDRERRAAEELKNAPPNGAVPAGAPVEKAPEAAPGAPGTP